MSSLYEIESKYLSIIDELEESGGELTPELEKDLEVTQAEFKSKCNAYFYIIKQLEGEVATIGKEISRLQDLEKKKNKNIERLKEALKNAVKLFGVDGKSGNKTVKLDNFSMFTVNKKKVVIDILNDPHYLQYIIKSKLSVEDLNLITRNLKLDIITEPVPNKLLIEEDLKDGLLIDGARLVDYDYLVMK